LSCVLLEGVPNRSGAMEEGASTTEYKRAGVQQGAFSSVLHEKRDFAGYFNYYAHIEV